MNWFCTVITFELSAHKYFVFVFVEVELEDTRQENMTLRWQNGAISNFEYLMYLNRLVKFISKTINNFVVLDFSY